MLSTLIAGRREEGIIFKQARAMSGERTSSYPLCLVATTGRMTAVIFSSSRKSSTVSHTNSAKKKKKKNERR